MTWDWGDPVRYRVRDLYIVQNKPLCEVIKIVNEQFGMTAKERTYQKHIRKWGFSKGGTRGSRQTRLATPNRRTTDSISQEPQSSFQTSFAGISFSAGGIPSDHNSFTSSDLSVLEAHSSARGSSTDDMEFMYDVGLETLGEGGDLNSEFLEVSSSGQIFEGSTQNVTGSDFRFSAVTHGSSDTGPANLSSQITTLPATYFGGHCAEIQDNQSRREDILGGSSMVRDDLDTRPNLIQDLSNKLGPSTIAIQTATAYIDFHTISLSDYMKLYYQTFRNFVQNTECEFTKEKHAEVTAFETSLQKLSAEDDSLLLFCSFLDCNNIALETLVRFLKRSPISIDLSISRLSHYRLVSQTTTSKGISIDTKVHRWLRDRIPISQRPLIERKTIMEASSSIALGCIPSKEDWEFARLVTPHFTAFIETMLRYDSPGPFWDGKSLRAATVIADVTRRLGEDKKTRIILEHILPLMEDVLGKQDSLTLDTMNSLSVTLISRRKWKSAEDLLRKLIVARQQSPDTDGCCYITELSNWARVLVKLGQHNDAQKAVDLIIERGNTLLIGNSSETRKYKKKLGETYRFCGELMKAESLLLSVHKESRTILGGSHTQTLRALEHLCHVYYDQKDWVSAEKFSSELVSLSEKSLGKMQTDTIRRKKFLEKVNRKRGKSRQ